MSYILESWFDYLFYQGCQWYWDVLASVVNGFVCISAFASLDGIPIGIESSAIELKICTQLRKLKSIS